MWYRACVIIALLHLKPFPHVEQEIILRGLNAQTPAPYNFALFLSCVLMCVFSDDFCVNALEHVLHMFALTPVCVLMCVLSEHLVENELEHVWHEYGLCPVCVRLCVTK